ncbi:MAG TPA: hypothetical protein VLI72_05510 [Methylibium sp.]|nr:hypothetical protein [Methylibium sp.]
MDHRAAPPVLAAALGAAQADADRFHGTAPVRPWRRRLGRGGRLWLMASLAVATGVAGAVATQRLQPAVAATGTSPPAAPRPRPVVAAPSTPPRPMARAPRAVVPAATQTVLREGDEWVIELVATSLGDAARSLAGPSGTLLSPDTLAALDAAGPVTRHWRGRELGAAWRALLGDGINHALQCGSRSCRLWALGAAAAATGATPPPAAPLPPAPPGLFSTQQPPADGGAG